jgi:PPIC-type PPIASE domain
MTRARAGRVPGSVKRTLALLVAVASAAVVLSGCGSAGDPPAAKVGSSTISRSTVEDQLQMISESKAISKSLESRFGGAAPASGGSVNAKLGAFWVSLLVNQAVADQIFTRRHLTVTAKDRAQAKAALVGLFADAATFGKLPRSYREAVLRSQARYEAVRASLPKPAPASDAQLQQLLDQTRQTACPSGKVVAHILVKTKDEADAVEAALAQGADFATLARERSTDTGSAATNGLIACTDTDQYNQFPVELRTAVGALAIGAVSAPFQSQFGWHVVKLEAWDLENARPVMEQFFQQQQGDPMAKFINAQLLKTKQVWVDPRYGTVKRTKLVVRIEPPVVPNPRSNPVEPTTTTVPGGSTSNP